MKHTLVASFVLGFFISHSAVGEEYVVPRLSPLETFTETSGDGSLVSAERVSVTFGTLLPVLDRDDDDALLVRFPDGREALVRASEVYEVKSDVMVVPKAAETAMERPLTLFWDSPLRTEAFLRSGPSNASGPLFQEVKGSRFPEALPIARSHIVESQLGRSILIAEGLIPVDERSFSALGQTSEDVNRRLSLHVVVDGSVYARDFSQRRLSEISRQLEPSTGLPSANIEVTRTVIFEDGSRTEVTPMPLSGLRQLLPISAAQAESGLGFSAGFVSAIRAVTAEISTSEDSGRDHIILLLVGPGLPSAIVEDAFFTQASADLAALTENGHRIGLLMTSVTPEPSETPQSVLSAMSARLSGSFVAFGESLTEQLDALYVSLSTRGRSRERTEPHCDSNDARKFLCLAAVEPEKLQGLIPTTGTQELEWMAFPLWFVVDGSILTLEQRSGGVSLGEAYDKDISADQDATQSLLAQRDQIRVLEEGIQTATSELSEAQDRISTLQTEVSSLNSLLLEREQTQHAQERLGQEKLRALEETLARLEGETEKYVSQISALSVEIADKAEEVQLLEKVRSDLSKELTDLKVVREREASERAVLQADYNELELELSSIKVKISTLDQENAALRSRFQDTEALLANALIERDNIQRKLSEAQNSLAALEGELAQNKAELESAQVTISAEREKSAALETTANRLNAESERMRQQVLDERTEFGTKLLELQERLSVENAARSAAEQRVESLLSDYSQLEEAHRALQLRSTDWEKERRSMMTALSESQSELVAGQQNISRVKEQLNKEITRSAALSQREQEQAAMIRSLDETITAQKRELEELNNLLVARMETNGVSEALVVSVEELRSKSALLQEEVTRLQAEKTHDAARIQDLADHATELDLARAAADAFLRDLTNKIEVEAAGAGLDPAATGSIHRDLLENIDSLFDRLSGETQRSGQARAEAEAVKQALLDRDAQDADRSEAVRKLSERLRVLEGENANLLGQIEIARGVAQENMQLVDLIKKAEQQWAIREETLLAEIQDLKADLAVRGTIGVENARIEDVRQPVQSEAAEDPRGELVATVPNTRPVPRPADLLQRKPDPEPTNATPATSRTRIESAPVTRVQTGKPSAPAAALPGSLFVRGQLQQNSSTVAQGSGGFFGQD